MVVILDITCIYKLPEDQKQLDNDRKLNTHGWNEEEQDGYVKRNLVIVSEED